MFNFLKNIFKSSNESNYDDYLNDVAKKFENNSCEKFAVFSDKGFNLVMDLLLNKIQYSLYMFIEKRDLFFDNFKLMVLENKLKNMQKNGGEITIITYNNEKDPIFLDLEQKFSDIFKYIPIKTSTPLNKINNFVIVDNKSYLLEDTLFERQTINDTTKAEVNIFDYNKAHKLIELFNGYIEKIKEN